MPDAHTQTVTLHITEFYPSHAERASDLHYAIFQRCRVLLKREGKLVCWVCGSKEQPELHHSLVEFALQTGIDVQKFALDHPQFNLTDEESFFKFVEGPSNLLVLCKLHHVGKEGIHCLPYPVWENLRYEKEGQPAFGVLVTGPASVEVPAGAAAVVEAVTPNA